LEEQRDHLVIALQDRSCFYFLKFLGLPLRFSGHTTGQSQMKRKRKTSGVIGLVIVFSSLSAEKERESVAYRRPTRVAAASVELSFIETFVAARIETSRVVSVGSLWCSQGPSART
jgi:hypothetical protein